MALQEVLALQRTHDQRKEKRLADRFRAILCLNKGFSYAQTADLLMLDDNTVCSIYELYKSKEVDGLSQLNYRSKSIAEYTRKHRQFLFPPTSTFLNS